MIDGLVCLMKFQELHLYTKYAN